MLISIRFKLSEDDIAKVGTQIESGMGGNERYISHIYPVYTEVEFVHSVTAGGSVKFLPAV